MSSTQKRAILQVRIREEDKQHAEHLYDAMGTSLAEAVRLFVAQSILMRKLPFQPVPVRSKDGTAAYGSLMDIYFLGTQNRIVAFCGKILNPGIALLGAAIGVPICFERHHHRRDRHPTLHA